MTGHPLRRRLMVGVVAVLAAVIVVTGVLSVVSLRGFLVERLDEQLTAAGGRSQEAVGGPRPPYEGEKPDFVALPGQREGTVGALITPGGVAEAFELRDGVQVSLDDAQSTVLGSVSTSPTTVDLGELGTYRAVLTELPDGGSLVVGLPLDEVDGTVARLSFLIAGIGLLALFGAAVAGTLVVRLALRPLDRVAATASRVSELKLDRGEPALAERVADVDADPRTEVGRVGAALNRMLENVASALSARQASEAKVRTFVADAGHELRTPLASIRGYAELTRRSGHDLPPDVAHALGRVESESIRMTGLVEDLLMLARLEDGAARPAAPVDVSRVLVDAVGDVGVAGPAHDWGLEMPEEPVIALADESAVRQIVVNLLANARVHTPEGTAVTVRLSPGSSPGDPVVVEVEDDGPGIADDQQGAVFERFVRGDASRARSTGSTGLGLAIVRALAVAQGGGVSLASAPGRTVFRVELPAG